MGDEREAIANQYAGDPIQVRRAVDNRDDRLRYVLFIMFYFYFIIFNCY